MNEVHLGGSRSGSTLKYPATTPTPAQDHPSQLLEGLQQQNTSFIGLNGGDIPSFTSETSSGSESSSWSASPHTPSGQRESLTSDNDLSVVDVCDRLRILDLSPNAPEDPRLNFDPDTRERLTALRMSSPKTKTKGIECSICYQTFEANDRSVLLKHLDRHFQDLKSGHTCNVCQIAFTHAKDLQRHLDSATQGNCGFAFKHVEPCSGHHLPPYNLSGDGSRTHGTKQNYIKTQIKVDDDRFNFCLRIKHWEQAQLARYISRVKRISVIGKATRVSPHAYLTWFNNLESDKEDAKRLIRSDPGDTSDAHLQVQLSHSLTYRTVCALPRATQSQCAEYPQDDSHPDCVDVHHTNQSPKMRSPAANDSLERAACAGDLEMTCSLLVSNEYPWKNDDNGFNSLHYAALFGFDGVLKLLLDAGAPVDSVDAQGRTSLALAVSQYHYSSAELLLYSGADPNAVDSHGNRLLFNCSGFVDDSFTLLLIRHGAAVDAVRQKVSKNAGNALFLCYPEQSQTPEHGIDTPAQNAARHGRSIAVFHLLNAGASLTQRSACGKTLVDLALKQGHYDLASQLLVRGAPIGHPVWACRALEEACSKQQLDTVEMLLSAGIRPDPDSLCVAVGTGSSNLVKALLQHGASVNSIGGQPSEGRPFTPLAVAISTQDAGMAAFLLDQGADVNQLSAKDLDEGRITPLMLAVGLDDVALVTMLLSRGANAEVRSFLDTKDAQRLCPAGDDLPLGWDSFCNLTAIDTALWCGQSEIAAVLVEFGATPADQLFELLAATRTRRKAPRPWLLDIKDRILRRYKSSAGYA